MEGILLFESAIVVEKYPKLFVETSKMEERLK